MMGSSETTKPSRLRVAAEATAGACFAMFWAGVAVDHEQVTNAVASRGPWEVTAEHFVVTAMVPVTLLTPLVAVFGPLFLLWSGLISHGVYARSRVGAAGGCVLAGLHAAGWILFLRIAAGC